MGTGWLSACRPSSLLARTRCLFRAMVFTESLSSSCAAKMGGDGMNRGRSFGGPFWKLLAAQGGRSGSTAGGPAPEEPLPCLPGSLWAGGRGASERKEGLGEGSSQ